MRTAIALLVYLRVRCGCRKRAVQVGGSGMNRVLNRFIAGQAHHQILWAPQVMGFYAAIRVVWRAACICCTVTATVTSGDTIVLQAVAF
jgi:hypothetical protein